MILKDYYPAASIEEVVSLLHQSKKNVILGGTHWLKLGDASYNLGIDISRLGLDQIEETESHIELGSYVSLRQLETHPLLLKYAPILKEAVSGIVGVQFRNTARLGASVYSHFGFSDITSALLTLDAQVEIDGDERIPLPVYLNLKRSRHFITRIIIKKEQLDFYYSAMRQNATSLPYFIIGIGHNHHGQWRISVGARPHGAVLARKAMHYLNEGGTDPKKVLSLLMAEVELHDNRFASKAYREHLAGVFLERGLKQIWK